MHILFIFLDGVGLGSADPAHNPFASAVMPTLQALLGGCRLLLQHAPGEFERASLLALDAGLGVSGLPQSATGQAVLLTGRNVPAELGYHYGPKPNKAVGDILRGENLFMHLNRRGLKAGLLNAYPPGYFSGIESGRRMYSAIPLAVTSAGLPLYNLEHLSAGTALAADLTGLGLRERLGLEDIPIIPAEEAGRRMARLARQMDFAFFEYWLSDYAGHGQDMPAALALLEELDQALAGLLDEWNDEDGLVLITSDHGNLEDLSTRRHTANPVPAVIIGAKAHRQRFMEGLQDIQGITPAVLRLLERE